MAGDYDAWKLASPYDAEDARHEAELRRQAREQQFDLDDPMWDKEAQEYTDVFTPSVKGGDPDA